MRKSIFDTPEQRESRRYMLLLAKAWDEVAHGDHQAIVRFYKEHPPKPTDWSQYFPDEKQNSVTLTSQNAVLSKSI